MPKPTPALESLEVGKEYRICRNQLGGYNYAIDYDEGKFIHVKVLSGPSECNTYKCTTFGDDGKHLGPGGGWTREYEEMSCSFFPSQLEDIPTTSNPSGLRNKF